MWVLVDTSVWISHFRQTNATLVQLLQNDQVLMHPLVRGEIACGTPPQRRLTLDCLQRLRPATAATIDEALAMIERHQLFGKGCGLIDCLLLASARLSACQLWTLDKRLQDLAAELQVQFIPTRSSPAAWS